LAANGDEPNTVLLDVGALPAGTYRLTGTVTTATGQHAELVATFTVSPTPPLVRDTAPLPGTL
jgi:hypothetical protein